MIAPNNPGPAMPADAIKPARFAAIRLGGWSFYFLAKVLLFCRELISFHPLENLAFAAFLLAPIYSQIKRRLRTVTRQVPRWPGQRHGILPCASSSDAPATTRWLRA